MLVSSAHPRQQHPRQSESEQDQRRWFRDVDQVDCAQVSATVKRTNDGQIVGHKIFAQAGLSHHPEAQRAKAAAEGRLEDIVVGVIVKATAKVLCCVAREYTSGGIDVDRCQPHL